MEYIPILRMHSKDYILPERKHIYGHEFHESACYQTIREAGRKDFLLIYSLAGSGRAGHGEMEIPLGPGILCLYEPGAFQDYGTAKMPGYWHFLWVHFDTPARFAGLIDWPLWREGIRFLQVPEGDLREEIEGSMRRVIRFGGGSGLNSEALAFLALEEVFLIVRPIAIGGGRDLRIQRAMDHMTRHYARKFDLKLLARVAGLSISRLSCLFQLETGSTLREFQEGVRMEHASSFLLLTQLPVAEVAAKCGYEDALYFSKRFRRLKGTSPSEFRKSNKDNL